MEVTFLSFRPRGRIIWRTPAERVASDARNLVRDWFRRQMPQTGFVAASSPAAPIPADYSLAM